MQFNALRGVLAVFALGAFTFVSVATPVAAAVPSLRSAKAIFEDVKVFKNLVYNKPEKDVNEASDRSANVGELVQEKVDVAFVDDTDDEYVDLTDKLFNLAFPMSFWEDLMKLGGRAKQYSEYLMSTVKAENDAAVGYKLHRMRSAVGQLVLDAGALRRDVEASAYRVHGESMEDIGKKLDSLMAELFEQLKVMFPPPDHAPGHLERKEKVDAALGKLEEALIHFGVQCGVSEESMRAHTANIIRTIEVIAITTGDLMEQHPHLTDTVVAIVVFMIVPEELILRPILSVLGFGPSGPIKGSAAAWAQRVFFGAEVKAGSWFAHLQECGVSEESMRAHTANIIRTIEDIAITTGDLMEQHPHLTDTVVAIVVFMIVPEELILRPILSVLGFGPSGPIKGSAAAWAQRVFFGAEVKAGSWFAHLQEAGMVSKIPESVKKGLWAGIIGVIGGANAIGHSFFDI
ncbi:uncharacterized protein LAESUDRAFT_123182 [Laetiporus sulphureus 93-53]|uniref:Uncharacterized protein n=1 Tax=Laetiporus sulphureus 93-53 TaxID=1314785 RepID=A0A165ELC7_9APHY|nr:uncharacterized protein LAESUDRAFT_123182 [Laetiporus sulphureus 93-53]KZT07299.1 hypothetical protein LAESUDRAFT_123182 [Laetiporus sulphureus 93-53]